MGLITIEAAAARFKVSQPTIWRWVREFGVGKFTVPGEGKRTHINPEELKRKMKPRPKV